MGLWQEATGSWIVKQFPMDGPPKTIDPPTPTKVTYSGSGWLFQYQIGVSQALRDAKVVGTRLANADADVLPDTRTTGASGGALAAASQVLDVDRDVARSVAMKMWDRASGNFLDHFRLDQLVDDGMNMFRGEFESAHTRWKAKHGVSDDAFPHVWQDVARGRLAVHFGTLSLLPPFYRKAVRCDYASFEDLHDSLVASCLVPGFAKLRKLASSAAQVTLDNAPESSSATKWNTLPWTVDPSTPFRVVDGGVPPQPEGEKKDGVINVTPIWIAAWLPQSLWPADIVPEYLPIGWALWPPKKREVYDALFLFGYRDGMRYAAEHGFVTKSQAYDLERKMGSHDDERLAALAPSRVWHGAKAVVALGALGCVGALGHAAFRKWRPRVRR